MGVPMTVHDWTLESIHAYVAGGLEAEDRGRIEEHVVSCPACMQALEEARELDQAMDDLFRPAWPKPGLEDRAIRSLRQTRKRGPWKFPWVARIGLGAAAVVLVGLLGFVAEQIMSADRRKIGISRENAD